MLTAYIDETLRRRPDDDSIYAMAAVIMDSADHDDIRTTLESLRLSKRHRLHWRDESPPHRLHIAETVAKLPLQSIVTVRIHDKNVRHERARRLCMEHLLYELDTAGVATVPGEPLHRRPARPEPPHQPAPVASRFADHESELGVTQRRAVALGGGRRRGGHDLVARRRATIL
ncbi:hypothetical protein ABZU32_00065 [Sphaerisporangium sp. NPDC005288]|uniref:hypothetical protein n=1 Tax=Sphaerisporangium sp. NPDC005288 TaxID=3155114 RepID=UPI0033AA1820